MLQSGIYKIECSNCKKQIKRNINAEELLSVTSASTIREQGEEIMYEVFVDDVCEYCNHHFSKITLYEYPEGVFEYGCTD